MLFVHASGEVVLAKSVKTPEAPSREESTGSIPAHTADC